MPILDLQRRLRQAGRIRIGQQVPTGNGKTRPAKLSTFRFTSADEAAIRAAAERFGGEPQPWDGAPVGDQWEVVSAANVIPVVVPPSATAYSAWYEQWSGGGCLRRCDGETEMLSDQPCLCASEDERSCTPHTRLNVILRDLPGIGVWRLDTSGWYAATELAGTVEVIAAAATRGQLLPAVLRLEERQVKRPGEGVKKFAVPVLDITMTPTALGLVVGQSTPTPGALPDAAESWHPIRQAALAELGTGDENIGGAIRNAGGPGPRRTKRTAPELPPTGVRPRGMLSTDEPPPPPPPDDAEPPVATTGPSQAQTKKVMAMFAERNMKDRAQRLNYTSSIIGRDIESWNDVTVEEARAVIDFLETEPVPESEPHKPANHGQRP